MNLQSITRSHGYPSLLVLVTLSSLSAFVACGGKSDDDADDTPAQKGGSTSSEPAGAPSVSGAASAGRGGQGGASAGASGSAAAGEGGTPGAAGSAGFAGEAGSGNVAGAGTSCVDLGGSCEFASECCSRFCNAATHDCDESERCPMPCGPGTYCSPSFDLDIPNTCRPAPAPQCEASDPRARCNRCMVQNCAAEVVFCGCTEDCFGPGGGCLPTCGPDFAGFNECGEALCKDEC